MRKKAHTDGHTAQGIGMGRITQVNDNTKTEHSIHHILLYSRERAAMYVTGLRHQHNEGRG